MADQFDNPTWEIKVGGINEKHWIDLDYGAMSRNMDGTCTDGPARSAAVRFDGCIHLKKYWFDGEGVNSDYTHICDVDEEIKILTELKTKAIAAFKELGEEWPR